VKLSIMAGYSATPLARKLGIRPHSRLLVLDGPDGFAVPELPDGVTAHRRPSAEPYDTILLFAREAARLRDRFGPAAERLTTAGGLWVCWPKKASKVPTDLGDGPVRAIGLAYGLVDNKVCAVDDVWSGLRFVRRLADR
jgi:hypothetical protein